MPNIFGILKTVAGEPIPQGKLVFRPESPRPARIGEGVRSARGIEVTADDVGYFTTPLAKGPHYLWIEDSDRTLICVPSTPAYILLADLLERGDQTPPEAAESGQNWRLSNAARQLLNATTGGYNTPFVAILNAQREVAFEAAGIGGETANFRYRGGMLEILCEEESTWHAPFLNDGAFALAAHGDNPVICDRMVGAVWQLKDMVTGKFRTWFIVGAAGQETLAFGPEVS